MANHPRQIARPRGIARPSERSILPILCFFAFAAAGQSVTFTVRQDGAGSFETIQAAIDAAADGDTIIVYPGVYGESIDLLGKDLTLRSTAAADPMVVATTVIDPQGAGRAILIANGETANCRVEGFTVRNGATTEQGAGIVCFGASPRIAYCVVSGNRTSDSTAGIGLYDSRAELRHCTIAGNTAAIDGAGIAVYGSTPTLVSCIIEDNRAQNAGGGIYCFNSRPEMTDCTVRNNEAFSGGGMFFERSSPQISECTFTDNRTVAGTGLPGLGGAIRCQNNTGHSPLISRCTIANNESAGSGGGLALHEFAGTVERCTIDHNVAGLSGGGLWFRGPAAGTIVNCVFWANRSSLQGGAVDVETGLGPTMVNCTIYGNQAEYGSGGGLFANDAPAQVVNCIFSRNLPSEVAAMPAREPFITYSCIVGGYIGPGFMNIDFDPLLADPEAGNFHLRSNSLCIDSGGRVAWLTEDFEGDPRPVDIISRPVGDGSDYDMGADEFFLSSAPPDLLVSSADVHPTVGVVGDSVQVNFTVANITGTTAGQSLTNVYLSANSDVDATDHLWRQGIQIPQLRVGRWFSYGIILEMPSLPAGQYYVLIVCDATNIVGESNESNNVGSAGVFELQPSLPDLTIASPAIDPNNGLAGVGVQVAFAVANRGGSTAASSWVHIYLSNDARVDASDYTWRQGIMTPQLPAGEQFDISDVLTVPGLPPGQYHVLIECDAGHAVGERDEGNNVADAGVFWLNMGPDLAFALARVEPPFGMSGDGVRVTFRVSNIGGSPTGESWAHVYLSADGSLDWTDHEWHPGALVSPLPVGAGFDFSEVVPAPDLAPGPYHVLFRCDSTDAVIETNESNNTINAGIFWLSGKPDLEVSGASVDPPFGVAGEGVRVSFDVVNTGGSTASPTWAHVYLSTDGALDGTDRVWWQGIAVAELAAGARAGFSQTLAVPALPPGQYHALFQCDVLDSVAESDETDNVVDGGIFWLNAKPDLRVEAVSLGAGHGLAGEQIRVAFTIVNGGGSPAGSTWAHVYLSSDGRVGAGDYLWRQGIQVPQLPAGGRYEFAETMTVPGLPPRLYHPLIQCDVSGAVDESNEANNVADPGGFMLLSNATRARRWGMYR